MQTVEGGIAMSVQGILNHTLPMYNGLVKAFGADPPQYVVCDYATTGCHDFAQLINAVLIINQPDVLQSIVFRWNDWMVPFFDVEGTLRTPQDVHTFIATHQSATLAGTLTVTPLNTIVRFGVVFCSLLLSGCTTV